MCDVCVDLKLAPDSSVDISVVIVIGVLAVSIIMTLLGIMVVCMACIMRAKKLNRQNSVGTPEKYDSHIYDSIDSIGISQEHSHIMETSVTSGEAMGSRSADVTAPAISTQAAKSFENIPLDASSEVAVTEAAATTSSNKAYGCSIEKADERPYTNVDLFEATTLFYTTSDGTRTYRPPQPATGRAAVSGEEKIIADMTPAINPLEGEYHHYDLEAAEDTCPEAAIDTSSEAAVCPEAATKTNTEVIISSTGASPETTVTEDACPVATSSNPAYGCAIGKVEDRPYTNVDLFEATTQQHTPVQP